jgi:hypothetical protein
MQSPDMQSPDIQWSVRSYGHPFLGRSARGYRPASGLMTRPTLLRGGQAVSGALVITLEQADPIGVQPTDGLDLTWPTTALAEQRRMWDGLELGHALPSVPDAGVQDMLVACARNIMQARELEDGLPVLKVGPTIYRGLWLVDGHFMLEVARYLGWDEIADAGIDVLLRRVQPDGSIVQMQTEPHLKETAIAISTLVRQAELTGDLAGLRRRWPVVRGALDYIGTLREQARALPAEHPFKDLVPPGFADGGIGGLRAEYTTVAWILIGLRYARDGAALLGRTSESETISAELDSLIAAFADRYAVHRVAIDGDRGYLPTIAPGGGSHQFFPELPDADVPRWREAQPETATWAMCQAVWPGQVFEPGSATVADLLSLMDARDDAEGIPATTGWLPWQALWTYAASFAAHAWLYAGRPDKAVDYLYAFANHAAPTRVWREEQPLAGTGGIQVCGDMPHNWASAEFVRLVRHLLVFERGPGLDVLHGVPAEWWHDGARIVQPSSPTAHGPVGVQVRVVGRSAYVSVSRGARPGPDVPVSIALPESVEVRVVDGEARADRVRVVHEAGRTLVLTRLAPDASLRLDVTLAGADR